MKQLTISSLALLVIGFAPVALADGEGPTNISGAGHWDIEAYDHDGDLELKIGQHVGTNHTHFILNGSIINFNFGTNAKVDVPSLGSLWVTPHDEEDADLLGMPFIGFSAKELNTNSWTGLVTFTMTGFSFAANSFTVGTNTGNFFMFHDEDIYFNSTTTTNFGSYSVAVGQHGHGEFGFSDAGLYNVTLVASGTNNNSPVSSSSATVTFNVVPEPSTYALLGLGAGALALLRWRRQRRS